MNTQCPICSNELENGTLRSRGLPYFLPDGQKPVRLHTSKELTQKNAVAIQAEETGDFAWPRASICRTCKMIFIPYLETE